MSSYNQNACTGYPIVGQARLQHSCWIIFIYFYSLLVVGARLAALVASFWLVSLYALRLQLATPVDATAALGVATSAGQMYLRPPPFASILCIFVSFGICGNLRRACRLTSIVARLTSEHYVSAALNALGYVTPCRRPPPAARSSTNTSCNCATRARSFNDCRRLEVVTATTVPSRVEYE